MKQVPAYLYLLYHFVSYTFTHPLKAYCLPSFFLLTDPNSRVVHLQILKTSSCQMHLHTCCSVTRSSPLSRNFVYPEDGRRQVHEDSKGGSLPVQGQILLEANNKQQDSSTKDSTLVSSKEEEAETTKGAHAILPTSEASSTDYMLTQHKARFLQKSSNPLISLPSAHSWLTLFRNKYL